MNHESKEKGLTKKNWITPFLFLAGPTGLEPAASGVTADSLITKRLFLLIMLFQQVSKFYTNLLSVRNPFLFLRSFLSIGSSSFGPFRFEYSTLAIHHYPVTGSKRLKAATVFRFVLKAPVILLAAPTSRLWTAGRNAR
jgi:hypothetical protein